MVLIMHILLAFEQGTGNIGFERLGLKNINEIEFEEHFVLLCLHLTEMLIGKLFRLCQQRIGSNILSYPKLWRGRSKQMLTIFPLLVLPCFGRYGITRLFIFSGMERSASGVFPFEQQQNQYHPEQYCHRVELSSNHPDVLPVVLSVSLCEEQQMQ